MSDLRKDEGLSKQELHFKGNSSKLQDETSRPVLEDESSSILATLQDTQDFLNEFLVDVTNNLCVKDDTNLDETSGIFADVTDYLSNNTSNIEINNSVTTTTIPEPFVLKQVKNTEPVVFQVPQEQIPNISSPINSLLIDNDSFPQKDDISSTELRCNGIANLIEPSTLTIEREREVLKKSKQSENKEAKGLQMAAEEIQNSPSHCQEGVVDLANTSLIKDDSSPQGGDTSMFIEPSISTIERDVLKKNENRKTKLMQIPADHIENSPSHCVKQLVSTTNPLLVENIFSPQSDDILSTTLHCSGSTTLIEPSISTIENKKLDDKEPELLQIPVEQIQNSPSHCEKKVAGITNSLLIGNDSSPQSDSISSTGLCCNPPLAIEREVLKKSKQSENKEPKGLQMAAEEIQNSSSHCEREIVELTALHNKDDFSPRGGDISMFIETSKSTIERDVLKKSEDRKTKVLQIPADQIENSPSHCVKQVVSPTNPFLIENISSPQSDDTLSSKLHCNGITTLIEPSISTIENKKSDNREPKLLPIPAEQIQNSHCEKEVAGITKPLVIENYSSAPGGDISSTKLRCNGTTTLIEPSISTIEREVLKKSEKSENRKAKLLQIPVDQIQHGLSNCEKEVVGDDFAKNTAHILCECDQPGVSGGAVPMVTSFVVAKNKQDTASTGKEKIENTSNKTSSKPSLIPKLSSSFKINNKHLLGRTEKQSCLLSSSDIECKSLPSSQIKQTINKNIASQMLPLQDKLKTTSFIKQKMTSEVKKEEKNDSDKEAQNARQYQLRFNEKHGTKKFQKRLFNEFYKHITMLKQNVESLSEHTNLNSQIAAIEQLFKYTTELKNIANKLRSIDSQDNFDSNIENDEQITEEKQSASDQSGTSAKSKENNKIYIKFLASKSGAKKKKSCNTEVQTEVPYDGFISYDGNVTEKTTHEENSLKSSDSMDGVFIPSSEAPIGMEEEEEDEDGLDITITFPEFQQTIMHEANSHLSVCFSDISAEALCRLKRCPKEFTLRMDFVQGKMFFQSGRSTANNFSIGPDLKITECELNNKQSDIISIKPSTECIYTSQIIPVEGAKRKSSIKTLRSTDSELFNVVSLPYIRKKTSVATRSCITFKNEKTVSVGCLLSDRRYFNSMPQILSLTNILEEPALESSSRSALQGPEKKTRNRTLQRKRTNASLEKLYEA